MKLIYLTVDGRATVETTKIGTRMVETPDGYHPLTNDSVWQDAKRIRDPILLIIQGVLGAHGASMAAEDVKNCLLEIEIAERAFRKPSVSKIWQRALARAFEWLMKYGILLFIVAIAAYGVISALTGAI